MDTDIAISGLPKPGSPSNASLAVFPSETLREITNYLRLGPVIRLLLCGNRTLTERLSSSSGVRQANYTSRAIYRNPSLPPLFRHLKGVKSLQLYFSSIMIHESTDYRQLIDTLPSELFSLSLNFDDCNCLWDQLVTEGHPLCSNLQSLVLDTMIQNQHPLSLNCPSLTSLSIPYKMGLHMFQTHKNGNWLPADLRHLSLLYSYSPSSRVSNPRQVPLNLQYLSGRTSLKTLYVRECQSVSFDPENFSLPSLTHLELEEVKLYSIWGESSSTGSSNTDKNFVLFCRRLPPSLKTFRVKQGYSPPSSNLLCWSSLHQWSFDQFTEEELIFPPNATELVLPESYTLSKLIAALPRMPHTVASLDLGLVVATRELLSALPPTLTSLAIALHSSSLGFLPPSLIILELNVIDPPRDLPTDLVKKLAPSSPALRCVKCVDATLSWFRVPAFAAKDIPSADVPVETPDGAKWVNFEIIMTNDAVDAFTYLQSGAYGYSEYLRDSSSVKYMIRKGARRCFNQLVDIDFNVVPMPPTTAAQVFHEIVARYLDIVESDLDDMGLEADELWTLPPIPMPAEKTAEFLDNVRCMMHSGGILPETVYMLASQAISLKSVPMLDTIVSASCTPCRPLSAVLNLPRLLTNCILTKDSEFARWCVSHGADACDFSQILAAALRSDLSEYLDFIASVDPEAKIVSIPNDLMLLDGDNLDRVLERRWFMLLQEWVQTQYGIRPVITDDAVRGFLVFFSEQSLARRSKDPEKAIIDHALSRRGVFAGSSRDDSGANHVLKKTDFPVFEPYTASEVTDLLVWTERYGCQLSRLVYGRLERNIAHFAAQTMNLPLFAALLAHQEHPGSRIDMEAEDRAGMTPQAILFQELLFHNANYGARKEFSKNVRVRIAENRHGHPPEVLAEWLREEDETLVIFDQRLQNAHAVKQFWIDKILPTVSNPAAQKIELDRLQKKFTEITTAEAEKKKRDSEKVETPTERVVRPPRRFIKPTGAVPLPIGYNLNDEPQEPQDRPIVSPFMVPAKEPIIPQSDTPDESDTPSSSAVSPIPASPVSPAPPTPSAVDMSTPALNTTPTRAFGTGPTFGAGPAFGAAKSASASPISPTPSTSSTTGTPKFGSSPTSFGKGTGFGSGPTKFGTSSSSPSSAFGKKKDA